MFYFLRIGGHRLWLIVNTAVSSLSLLALAFCVRTFEARTFRGRLSFCRVVACVTLFIFAFFFGIGHGPIGWNFCAEVFPAHISTKCRAITTCTQWLFQVVNAVTTPLLLTSAGWYSWIVLFCINALTLVFCVLYIPETRDVSLGAPVDAAFGDIYKTMDQDQDIIEDVRPQDNKETSLL